MTSSIEPRNGRRPPDDARSPAPAGRRRPSRRTGGSTLPLLLALVAACATTSGGPADAALDAAVAGAAQELAEELAAAAPGAGLKLAVMAPTATHPSHADLARDLLHRVSDHLRQAAPGLVLVERDELEALWAEHALSPTGLLHPDETAELGRLLGADALLLGELVEIGGRLQLHLRIVDVASAEQLATALRSLAVGPLEGAAPASDRAPRTGEPPGDDEAASAASSTPSRRDRRDQAGPGGEAEAPCEPSAASPPPPVAPSAPGRVVVGHFELRLAGCGFVERQLICHVELHNLAPGERTLTVLGTSEIRDTSGDDYRLQRARLGTRGADFVSPTDQVSFNLPGELRANLELTFSGVPRRKRKLQQVVLHFAEGSARFPGLLLSRD